MTKDNPQEDPSKCRKGFPVTDSTALCHGKCHACPLLWCSTVIYLHQETTQQNDQGQAYNKSI